MKRRDFLLQVGAATLAGATPPSLPLRQQAVQKRLLFGTCVSRAELQRPQFTKVLGREAGIVVCENDMKWANIHPGVDQYDFTGGDLLLNFAAEHGQLMRGHNLCWHRQLPKWFEVTATPSNVEDLLRRHIATVAGHYKGRLHSWDVVNEAIQVKDGIDRGFRDSIWFKLAGPAYLQVAFQAAAEADPHAIFTYNDYGIEQDGPDCDAKRTAVLGLVRWLRDRNAPIQALGLQSHLNARATPDRWDALHAFIRDVEALGLSIFITELDVDDRTLPGDFTQRDEGVAAIYADYLSHVLQHKSVKAVLTWGLSDGDTWLTGFEPRKDGLPQRPLPFDAEMKPTAVYAAIERAIANAP